MFTGIVGAIGSVAAATPGSGGLRLRVASGGLDLADVVLGDSIAVNGVCLTVVGLDAGSFEADVSHETLACTAGFAVGDRVNLEKALRLADRLGGHLVTGHVDGVGRVSRFEPMGDNRLLAVSAPPGLAKYLARKGSVAVNGVSLTINEVGGSDFTVNLIPHTLSATNLGAARTGDGVNVEIDMLARYVEQLSNASRPVPTPRVRRRSRRGK
jgi:riboflavin synthase